MSILSKEKFSIKEQIQLQQMVDHLYNKLTDNHSNRNILLKAKSTLSVYNKNTYNIDLNTNQIKYVKEKLMETLNHNFNNINPKERNIIFKKIQLEQCKETFWIKNIDFDYVNI